MNIKTEAQIGARFKLIARKSNGSVARETDWFLNKVLTTGLNRMSVGSWIDRCCVGSGNSTPVASQTALDSFIASTQSVQSNSAKTQLTEKPEYYSATRTWRFAEGVAAGNISEVGMGWGNANLWNRALVKDSLGNPTTITVLSDEILDVVAEIRVYPTMDFTGSFLQKDKLGNIIQEHTYVGKARFGAISWSTGNVICSYVWIYTGSIGDYTSEPTGGGYTGGTNISTYPTPNKIKHTLTLGLNDNNKLHKSFLVQIPLLGLTGGSSNQNGYKVEITPGFTKTSAMKVTYTFEYSWAEFTGG